MLIIGCNFHTRFQQIAMSDDETGELLGVYRAELHKRALQRERTTAYLEPSKACGGELSGAQARSKRDGATGSIRV